MKYRDYLNPVIAMMAVILLAAWMLNVSQVNAQSSHVIKEQLQKLEEEKQALEKELQDVNAQYRKNEDEIADLIAQKNVIEQEINLLNLQTVNINEQIRVHNQLLADQQDMLDTAQAQYETLTEKNRVRIRAMEEQGSITYWQILFKANSFSDLLDRMHIVQEIAQSDKQRLLELQRAAESVKAAQTVLQMEKRALEKVSAELEATQDQLIEKQGEMDDLLQGLLLKAGDLEALIKEFEKKEAEFLTEILNKEAEYDEAKKKEWEAYYESNQPAPNDSGWVVPCSYVYLSSPFGYRDAPVEGASTYHQGVDLAAYRGTPVYATRTGIVTIADHGWSAGNYVQIDHGDGFKSIYMHLETYCVSAGQIVLAGQQIGTVGTSGVSSGYHLHFGISYNGVYVNPCAYVSLYG